jgi:Polo-like Kinase 4 Polo Box 2
MELVSPTFSFKKPLKAFKSQAENKIPVLFSRNLSPIAYNESENCEYTESMNSSRYMPRSFSKNPKFCSKNKENLTPSALYQKLPLITHNLKPFIHKFPQGKLEITESGWVKVTIRKKNLQISKDGLTILYQNKVLDLESIHKAPLKLYYLAKEFLDIIKSKTPKITIEEKHCKCMLMRNTPFPNYEAEFKNGVKVKYQIGSELFVVSTLDGKEILINPYLDLSSLDLELGEILQHSMEGLKKCLNKEKDYI